jgi:alpha-beta hydrolase superfamily lysophospholipase
MRQLAVRLSQAGFHTLRFDYFGSGDSAGAEGDTDVAGLQADVVMAIETVKDLAATKKVTLIGLRAGANVAASTAAAFPGAVDALVLWDPILAGDPCLGGALRDLQPLAAESLPDGSLTVVTRQPIQGPARALSTNIEFLPAPCPWTESVSISGVIPVRVIQRIEAWLR